MMVDIIINGETVMTISMKSVDMLLKTMDKTGFPVRMDSKEIIVQFRKEAGGQ